MRTVPLFVSRFSTAIPVETELDRYNQLMNYGIRSNLSPIEIINHCGFEENGKLVQALYDFASANDGSGKSSQDFINLFFSTHRDLVREHFETINRDNFEYFKAIGLYDASGGLVDLGWSSSMQRAIVELGLQHGELPDIHGFYLGTRESSLVPSDRSHGFLLDSGEPAGALDLIKRYIDILELLISYPMRSVKRVKRSNDGEFEVDFFPLNENEDRRIGLMKICREQLIAITEAYVASSENALDSLSGAASAGNAKILELLARPTADAERLFEDFPVFFGHSAAAVRPLRDQ
jgi:hypothetical protein